MLVHLLHHLSTAGRALVHVLQRRLRSLTKPAVAPLVVGTLADLGRSKTVCWL